MPFSDAVKVSFSVIGMFRQELPMKAALEMRSESQFDMIKW